MPAPIYMPQPRGNVPSDMIYQSLLQYAMVHNRNKNLQESYQHDEEMWNKREEFYLKRDEIAAKAAIEREKIRATIEKNKQEQQDKENLVKGVAAGTHTPLNLNKGSRPDPTRNNANVFNYGGKPVRIAPVEKPQDAPEQWEQLPPIMDGGKPLMFRQRNKVTGEVKYRDANYRSQASGTAGQPKPMTPAQLITARQSKVDKLTRDFGLNKGGLAGMIQVKNPAKKRTAINNLFSQMKRELADKNQILTEQDIDRVITVVLNDYEYKVNQNVLNAVKEAMLVGGATANEITDVFLTAQKTYFPEQ